MCWTCQFQRLRPSSLLPDAPTGVHHHEPCANHYRSSRVLQMRQVLRLMCLTLNRPLLVKDGGRWLKPGETLVVALGLTPVRDEQRSVRLNWSTSTRQCSLNKARSTPWVLMLVPFPVLPHQVLREVRAILMGILVPCHLAHRRNPEFKRPVQDRYLLDCVAERVVSLFLQPFRRSALRGNVANIQRTTYHLRPRAVLPIILCLRPQITVMVDLVAFQY